MASSSAPTAATTATTTGEQAKPSSAGSTSDYSASSPSKPLPFDPRFEDPNHGDLNVVINHFASTSTVWRNEGVHPQEIHLQEVSRHASAFGQLLSFLYPYQHTEVNADNVQGLLYFADKYRLSSKVTKVCETFLLTAQQYGLKRLLEKQVSWATSNLLSRVGFGFQRRRLDVNTCHLMLDHITKKLEKLSNLPCISHRPAWPHIVLPRCTPL